METSANIQPSGRQGGGAGTPLHAPGAGQVQVVEAAAGSLFELSFAAEDASLARSDNDLVFNFENGGRIVLAGFFAAGDTDALPQFTLPEGGTISGYEFLAALDPDLLPAAGPGAGGAGGTAGGGVGEYSDDAGSLIGGVSALDPLTTTGLGAAALVALTDDATTPDIDYGVSIIGSAVTVAERGLLADVEVHESSSAAQTGTFSVSAPDGIATVTVGGVTVVSGGSLVADEAARTVTTENGTLVITGYDAATGIFSYTYTLTDTVLASGDAYTFDVAVTATDTDGDTASGVISVTVLDDAPTAVADTASVTEDTSTTATGHLLDNDTQGADGATVTAVGTTNVAETGNTIIEGDYGTLTIAADGAYTYTLNNSLAAVQHLTTGETLTETFSYTLTDGDGDTSAADLTVTINGSDDGVTLSGLGESCVTVPESALADGSHPDSAALVQSGTFTVTAADGLDTISVASVTVISGGVLVTNEADRTITTDTGTLVITGYDAATGTVSYTFTLADNLTVAGDSADISYTVTATDRDGSSDTASLTVTVLDDAPTAVADTASVTEDTSTTATGHLLDNDTQGADGATVTAVGATSVAETGSTIIEGDYGTLTIAADGTYTYTLNNSLAAVQHLTTGETLTETFSYTLTDGDGDTSAADLTVTINGSNDGVTLSGLGESCVTVPESALADGSHPDSAALVQTGAFTVTAADGLDTISVANVTVISGGVLVTNEADRTITTDTGTLVITGYDAATGTVSYTFTLTDNLTVTGDSADISYTVTATDRDGSTDTASLTVTVLDDAPTAFHDTASVTEDTSTTATGHLLDNDTQGADGATVTTASSDYDTDGASIAQDGTITVQGQYGTLIIAADGTYTYTLNNNAAEVQALNAGQSVADVFSYTLTDADGDASAATLTVTVHGTNENTPPVALCDTATIHESDVNPTTGAVTVSIGSSVLGNDSDAETPDTLSVANAGTYDLDYGTLVIHADGTYTYTVDMTDPAVQALFASTSTSAESLSDTFTYTVSDGHGGTTSSTLTLSLVPDKLATGTSGDDTVTMGGAGNDVLVGDPGGVTETTVYATYNVAIILDSSGSMSESQLEKAIEALTNLIQQLEDYEGTVNLKVIDFDTGISNTWSGVLTESTITEVLAVLDKVSSGGGTNYEAAFNEAAGWFASSGISDNGGENVVYFVTDGEPTYYYKDSVSYTYTTGGPGQGGGPGGHGQGQGQGQGGGQSTTYAVDVPDDYVLGTVVYNSAGTARINAEGYLEYSTNNGTTWTTTNVSVLGGSGGSTSDTETDQSEAAFAHLLAQLDNDVAVNAIGIGSSFMGGPGGGSTTTSLLDAYDNTGGAQIITDASQLAAALDAGTTDLNPEATGSDTLSGGAGDDILFGDALNTDYLLTQTDWDHGSLTSGDSLAILKAYLAATLGHEASNDELRAYITEHQDALSGGASESRGAADVLHGGDGNDTLYGQGGDDTLYGDAGDDHLYGQGGNDHLYGGDGNDHLYGGDGNDYLDGGMGVDTLHGGAGNDTLVVHDTNADLTINGSDFAGLHGGEGYDTLVIDDAGVTLDFTSIDSSTVTGIEAIDLTASGAQTVTLSAADLLDLSATMDAGNSLTISGTSDDHVNLSGSGWTNTHTSQTVNGVTYDVYTGASGSEAHTLLVQHEIIVNTTG
ncbi:beta strand repeat-containing protein [Nitratidesulfovibrio termitidis]|uniref:beta strand repeat-containing protein n=1 Tax=Nitratidesulfovibrio termitidis TaxID=42252 RepID=UPI00040D93A8|nr:VCBS domain-containing protein [Nitratidesulfovibrio termitidis]